MLVWFGDFILLLSLNSVDLYNLKVVCLSMGVIFYVNMELNVVFKSLGEWFECFVFLDMNGDNIILDIFSDYQCYLFGNEVCGVFVDVLLQFNVKVYIIMGSGKIDLLNLVSVVNICVYELIC